MATLGLTEAEVARRSGVAPRTIQGWLTEGRRPRAIPLLKVESVVGALDGVEPSAPPRPPSIAEAVKRLRAAERNLKEARRILDQLSA